MGLADLSSDSIAPRTGSASSALRSPRGGKRLVSLARCASAIERMLNGETPAWLATTGGTSVLGVQASSSPCGQLTEELPYALSIRRRSLTVVHSPRSADRYFR